MKLVYEESFQEQNEVNEEDIDGHSTFQRISIRLSHTFGVASKKLRNSLLRLLLAGINYAVSQPENIGFLLGLIPFASKLQGTDPAYISEQLEKQLKHDAEGIKEEDAYKQFASYLDKSKRGKAANRVLDFEGTANSKKPKPKKAQLEIVEKEKEEQNGEEEAEVDSRRKKQRKEKEKEQSSEESHKKGGKKRESQGEEDKPKKKKKSLIVSSQEEEEEVPTTSPTKSKSRKEKNRSIILNSFLYSY